MVDTANEYIMTRNTDLEIHEALREIEQIEDELNEMDDFDELRERLTDARADLVGALMHEQLEGFDLRKEFSRQVNDAPRGSTIVFDEAAGEISIMNGEKHE